MNKNEPIIITTDKIIAAIEANIGKVLSDYFSGWDNPLKKTLESPEFKEKMLEMTRKMYEDIISRDDFQEKLKDRLFVAMVENLLKK